MIEFFYYLLVLFSYPFRKFMGYEIPSLKKEFWFKHRFFFVFLIFFFFEVMSHKRPFLSILYLIFSYWGYSREITVFLIPWVSSLDVIGLLLLNNLVESALDFSWRRYFLEYLGYIIILLLKGYFSVSTL